MELIVFDLDGTLLNRDSKISAYTHDTLVALAEQGIAYTVATGRTLHGAAEILAGNNFHLPQIFKNGVMIWHPGERQYSHQNFLTLGEIEHILEAILAQNITPFLFTLEPGNRHAIYHSSLQNEVEEKLAAEFSKRMGVDVLPVAQLPADAEITNISSMGIPSAIESVALLIETEPHLVAYVGAALEDKSLKWMDIHNSDASKGGAVQVLREQLGATKVLCFGDSDNDLSMFAAADECYAPDNAKELVKAAATEVIGHHDEDGIARYLRERFDLN